MHFSRKRQMKKKNRSIDLVVVCWLFGIAFLYWNIDEKHSNLLKRLAIFFKFQLYTTPSPTIVQNYNKKCIGKWEGKNKTSEKLSLWICCGLRIRIQYWYAPKIQWTKIKHLFLLHHFKQYIEKCRCTKKIDKSCNLSKVFPVYEIK